MKRLIGGLVACAMMAGSAGAETTYEVNTETRSESLRKDSLHLLAISGVTLGLSAVFAVTARDKYEQIADRDASVPWPDDIHLLERDGQRLATLSNITLVLGGAFLATSAICYWRSRVAASEERESAVTVAPMASSSSAGVALSGSF